mgnify:CR=1 FL=1
MALTNTSSATNLNGPNATTASTANVNQYFTNFYASRLASKKFKIPIKAGKEIKINDLSNEKVSDQNYNKVDYYTLKPNLTLTQQLNAFFELLNLNEDYDKVMINDKNTIPPFLPYSNKPEDIAGLIDKIVTSNEFRQELFNKQDKFVRELSDPHLVAEWWDNLFEEIIFKHRSITKKTSGLRIKLRLWYFLISNRLYKRKIAQLLALLKNN